MLRSVRRKIRILTFVLIIIEQVYHICNIVLPLDSLFALGLEVYTMITLILAVVARAQLALHKRLGELALGVVRSGTAHLINSR